MSQKAYAGKDLLQIGRDYIRHIQVNILSGNWGAVIVALAPFLILTILSGGVGFEGGASVTKKQFSSNIKTKDSEIRELQRKVTDVQAQQRTFDELHSKLIKAEKNIKTFQEQSNEKEQTINTLKRNLVAAEQTIKTLQGRLNEKEQRQSEAKLKRSPIFSNPVCTQPPTSKFVNGLRLTITKVETVDKLLRMGVKVENQSPGDQDLNDFHSQLYFQDNLGKLYAYERWGIRIPGSGFTTSELMLKEPIQPNASTISVNFGDIGGKKLCISGIPVK